mgnify:CR=1 FL=1
MKYVGSKNRISKELAPIIQSYITEDTKGYLEPFVGGANMIDKIKKYIKLAKIILTIATIILNFFNKKITDNRKILYEFSRLSMTLQIEFVCSRQTILLAVF